MKIRVEANRVLRLENVVSGSVMEVPDKCTVRDLLDLLKIPKVRQKSILVIVNGEPSWNSTRLHEDDVVKVLPVMGGG